MQSEDESREAPGRGEDRLVLSAAAFLDGVGEKLGDRADRRFPLRRVKNLLVCQTYVTHYAESFLESPLEISNPVVSSGSYCISCCESSTALKNLRKSRICV